MSASRLALSLFIYAQLLPLLFVFHILWLCATALWSGSPMAVILRDAVSIQDDICLPHPPGFYDVFSTFSEDPQDHDTSFNESFFDSDSDTSISTVEDSILSTTAHDITFTIPQIMVSDTSTDQLLATGSLYDLVIFDADAPLGDPLPPLSPKAFYIDTAMKETEFTVLGSPSDKVYVVDAYESSSDSIFSVDICDQHLDLTEPSLQVASPLPPPATLHSEGPQELDFTEEELLTLESLSIRFPPPLPSSTSIQDIVMPRVLDDTPIFSRYNIDDKVILPVRKLPSSPPRVRRNSASFSFSEEVNSVFNKVSTTWTKTKEELKRQRKYSSSMSWRLSVIGNFSLFKVEQVKSTIPLYDPYDSWPYVRSAVDHKDIEAALFGGEDDSFESMVKSALDYFKF
ncbi:hypothetical protein AX15_007815 [Amanita polypyramis BW_CC]|nr:hypothetical protein AX15_007815 [Amanita polypyramis BW_CC]